MSKYKIAWMPGDGVGHDVMEAARIVLDRMKFDAEYVPCDIGWEFWCKEGNALPDRTVKALNSPITASTSPNTTSHFGSSLKNAAGIDRPTISRPIGTENPTPPRANVR